MRAPLRIGLLLDSVHQPAWVQRTVSSVLDSGVSGIVVVIMTDGRFPAAHPHVRAGAGAPGSPRREGRGGTHRLFDLYRAFDTWWFRDDRPDPFVEVDLEPLLVAVPRLDWRSEAGTDTKPVADRIIDYDLDVVLQFGADAPLASIAALTRFGLWSHLGDCTGGTGYLEVLTGSPVTQSALEVTAPTGGEARAIYRSFASTSALSGWKNRRELYWKTSAFVARKLRELAEVGAMAVAGENGSAMAVAGESGGAMAVAGENGSAVAERRVAGADNLRMLGYLPRLAARYASTQVAMRTSFDQWFIAYRFAAGQPDNVPDTRLREFVRLTPPKDRMWADPFPMIRDGRHYVFLEELTFARNKGHISVMEFDRRGRPARPVMVLETENHLSYPFVLSWKGETFMIPESARAGDSPADTGSRSVPVFRASRFPFEWVQDSVMLEGLEVFDPTVVEIDGRWWLFCTQAEPGASTWDELHLFHGPSPFGPWTPHRRNPVKSDVRSARPAGRPYFHAGAWYRPAQNCSVRYGYGISINRIERLTPAEYREVEVTSMLPDWAPGLIGTHTLNAAGQLTVTDGRRRRSRWSREQHELPERMSTP